MKVKAIQDTVCYVNLNVLYANLRKVCSNFKNKGSWRHLWGVPLWSSYYLVSTKGALPYSWGCWCCPSRNCSGIKEHLKFFSPGSLDNIFNEKIYIFLWFWFLVLAVVTGFGMVYRAMTLFSPSVRSSTLRTRSKFLLTQNVCDRVVSKLRQGDWFFLSLVGANLDPHVFTRLVLQLDKLMASRNLGNGVISAEKLEKIA